MVQRSQRPEYTVCAGATICHGGDVPVSPAENVAFTYSPCVCVFSFRYRLEFTLLEVKHAASCAVAASFPGTFPLVQSSICLYEMTEKQV